MWVSGRNLAMAVRPAGMALMGNSAPEKNHGAKATAPMVATYSSWVGMRLASTSEIPYMAMEKVSAVATNNTTPVARTSKSAPRRAAQVTSTASCSMERRGANDMLAATSDDRGSGGASRSRGAPLTRSTRTPSPEDMQLNGRRIPTVDTATNVM